MKCSSIGEIELHLLDDFDDYSLEMAIRETFISPRVEAVHCKSGGRWNGHTSFLDDAPSIHTDCEHKEPWALQMVSISSAHVVMVVVSTTSLKES